MDSQRRRIFYAAAIFVFLAIFLPETAAVRYAVGGSSFWASGVNYTIWAQDKHFYNGDWLFFVYDRNQYNVLEVNETDYINCNEANFLHNWTGGAGRDVVPLNVTRDYYFISGHGFCYGGTKLSIHVENPPPPSLPPSSGIRLAPGCRIFIPVIGWVVGTLLLAL